MAKSGIFLLKFSKLIIMAFIANVDAIWKLVKKKKKKDQAAHLEPDSNEPDPIY